MLKSLFLVSLFGFLQVLQATSFDPPSTHGMLLFGKRTTYFSHLPMFHSPHDYQVILVVELDSASNAVYQKDQAAHPEVPFYTVAPERFSLPKMVATPVPFHADIFRGHFEKEGIKIASATVSIKQVLYFEKFEREVIPPKTYNAIVFGNSEEVFSAHWITASPDFDQICQVRLNPFAIGNGFSRVSLPEQANSIPLEEGKVYPLSLPAAQLEIVKSLYTEFDDLN